MGKSSLFNAIAGAPLSESGLIRPTTRRPVALVHPTDRPGLSENGPLAGITERDQLDVRVDPAIAPGLMIVDAPDFDSVERSNRDLALELLEVADLVIFVTTVTRYADQVPMGRPRLGRASGACRCSAVINRMPTDTTDEAAVMADYRRLIERGELDRQLGRLR